MAFQKGHKRYGGMKKGQKTAATKATIELKTMIRNALDKKGGEEWLIKQMDENPTAFITLLGKILPTDTTIAGGVNLIVSTGVPKP